MQIKRKLFCYLFGLLAVAQYKQSIVGRPADVSWRPIRQSMTVLCGTFLGVRLVVRLHCQPHFLLPGCQPIKSCYNTLCNSHRYVGRPFAAFRPGKIVSGKSDSLFLLCSITRFLSAVNLQTERMLRGQIDNICHVRQTVSEHWHVMRQQTYSYLQHLLR